MTEQIHVHQIVRDGGTQSRAALDENVIRDYAEAMRDGDLFPPILVFYDGKVNILADGFHRVAAAIEAGLPTIEAEVRQGTLEDAQWASYSVNGKHGLQRSRDDRQRAIIAALKHPSGAGKSDREIGRHVGVDHKTVGVVRAGLVVYGEIPQIKDRQVTRGDSTYIQNTAGINADRHWEVSGVGAFWVKVDYYQLDRRTILKQLQPDRIALIMTDLTMTKEETFARLDELATERLEQLFPAKSYVYHQHAGRVAQVIAHAADHLMVADPLLADRQVLQTWQVDGLLTATVEQLEEYLHPPFKLHDKVMTEVSDVVGEVIEVKVGMVCVRRRNPGSSTNVTNWVKVENVRRAPEEPSLAVGDWVKTRAGHIRQIVRCDANDRLVYLEGDPNGHYRDALTKVDPLPVADDQPAAKELALDEQLAEQVFSDDNDGPYGNGTLDDYEPEIDEQSDLAKAAIWEELNKLESCIDQLEDDEFIQMLLIPLATMRHLLLDTIPKGEEA